jgi:hypothetical protein
VTKPTQIRISRSDVGSEESLLLVPHSEIAGHCGGLEMRSVKSATARLWLHHRWSSITHGWDPVLWAGCKAGRESAANPMKPPHLQFGKPHRRTVPRRSSHSEYNGSEEPCAGVHWQPRHLLERRFGTVTLPAAHILRPEKPACGPFLSSRSTGSVASWPGSNPRGARDLQGADGERIAPGKQQGLRFTGAHMRRGQGFAITPCPSLLAVPSCETVTVLLPAKSGSKENCPISRMFAVLIVIGVLQQEPRGRSCCG